jgi:hypothetical protein
LEARLNIGEKNQQKYSLRLVNLSEENNLADSTGLFAGTMRNLILFGTVATVAGQIKKGRAESITRRGEA